MSIETVQHSSPSPASFDDAKGRHTRLMIIMGIAVAVIGVSTIWSQVSQARHTAAVDELVTGVETLDQSLTFASLDASFTSYAVDPSSNGDELYQLLTVPTPGSSQPSLAPAEIGPVDTGYLVKYEVDAGGARSCVASLIRPDDHRIEVIDGYCGQGTPSDAFLADLHN